MPSIRAACWWSGSGGIARFDGKTNAVVVPASEVTTPVVLAASPDGRLVCSSNGRQSVIAWDVSEVVSAAKRGLAIVSCGQMESAVRDLPERPIALTLFRSTRRTVITDGQPEGQLLGQMRFHYWIVPFSGTLPRTRLCQFGQQLGAGLRTAQLQPRHFIAAPYEGARLAAQGGLLEITGDAVCTSICQVDGTTEVRLFNPGERATSVRIKPGKAAKAAKAWTRAQPVDFESNPLGKALPLSAGIPLKPKQILTLRLC